MILELDEKTAKLVIEVLAGQFISALRSELRGISSHQFAEDVKTLRCLAKNIFTEYPGLRESYKPHSIFRMGLGELLTFNEIEEAASIEIDDLYIKEISRLLEAKRPRE